MKGRDRGKSADTPCPPHPPPRPLCPRSVYELRYFNIQDQEGEDSDAEE